MKVTDKILTLNVALIYTAHLKAAASLIKSAIYKKWPQAFKLGISVDVQIETIGGFDPKSKKIQDTSFICNDESDYIIIWSKQLFTKRKKKARRVILCFKDLGINGTIKLQFCDDNSEVRFKSSIEQIKLIKDDFIFDIMDWINSLELPLNTTY